MKGPSVTTKTFNAPIHRQANNGTSGNSTLMTLSASINGGEGPSVLYTGFPATTPAAVTTNNITITPSSVTDYYTGNETGYYLTSANAITSTGLSAGSGVNNLTATQTFANATVASASTPFYYDTPVTGAPACSINELNISSSTKVSGISIYSPPTGGDTPTLTVDASANNMGKHFYRSPLITYNYAINGITMGPTGENGLGAVNSGDISGNMFKTGTLRFSSNLVGTTDMTRIDISANAYNIEGSSPLTGRSFNVITDASSVTLVTQTLPSAIPELVSGASPVVGFRIWSAPSLISPFRCPDLSYNGVLYYTRPYNNEWDISRVTQVGEIVGPTATSYNNATTELLIKNGLFTSDVSGSTVYVDYRGFAGNSSINYSSIIPSATFRFASFCWKLAPTSTSTIRLILKINSINILPVVSGTSMTVSGTAIPILFCFQEAETPSNYGTAVVNGASVTYYNTVWLNANLSSGIQATPTNVTPSSTSTTNRFGTLNGSLGSAYPVTVSGTTGDYTATISAFVPTWRVRTTPTYLYVRICLPMNKEIKFGSVSANIIVA